MKWEKPQLIVLVRGAPEEFVLANCKVAVKVAGGALGIDTQCAGKRADWCAAGGSPANVCVTICNKLGSS